MATEMIENTEHLEGRVHEVPGGSRIECSCSCGTRWSMHARAGAGHKCRCGVRVRLEKTPTGLAVMLDSKDVVISSIKARP